MLGLPVFLIDISIIDRMVTFKIKNKKKMVIYSCISAEDRWHCFSNIVWSHDINCVVRFWYVSLNLPTMGFKFISRRLRFQPAHYARAWTRNSLTALPWSFPHDDCIGCQYQHKEKYDRLSWPPHGMYSSLQNHCIDFLRQGVNWTLSVQSMVKILDLVDEIL